MLKRSLHFRHNRGLKVFSSSVLMREKENEWGLKENRCHLRWNSAKALRELNDNLYAHHSPDWELDGKTAYCELLRNSKCCVIANDCIGALSNRTGISNPPSSSHKKFHWESNNLLKLLRIRHPAWIHLPQLIALNCLQIGKMNLFPQNSMKHIHTRWPQNA